MRLLQKSCFVIPELVIGNPVSLKNKDFWIPVSTGMTAQVFLQGLLQEPHDVKEFMKFLADQLSGFRKERMSISRILNRH